VNMAATSPGLSILPSAIADQYELLRCAAFGQALPLKPNFRTLDIGAA